MSSKFSVVISTYNRSKYVLEAIASVSLQTFAAHEIIVVSDGSIDGTVDAVRNEYPGVVVIEQPNRGVSIARNTGVARASGDWVCFVDDDDLWHRNKLQATADYLAAHPDCLAVRNPVWFFSETSDGPESAFGYQRDFVAATLDECHNAVATGDPSVNSYAYLDIEGNSFRLLLESNRGVLSSTVIHRETYIRAGGCCPMQTYGDDWTMFVNVARLCEWHTIPCRLGFTRLHGSQSTGDPSNGLYTLAGIVNAWYCGRPMPEESRGVRFVDNLRCYGKVYKRAVQGHYWGAVRARKWSLAKKIRLLGELLLPSRADYLYVLVPPQITWRWERYVLGMHK